MDKVRTYLTGDGAVAAQGGVAALTASATFTTFVVDHDWWLPGRVSKVEHSGLASGTQVTSYAFDLAGRITQKVTPAQTDNYSYDATNQLTLVTNAGGTTVQDPNFNAAGNETSYAIGAYNRVMNDGTYSDVYNNERSRTRRTKLCDGSCEVYPRNHRQRMTSVKAFTAGNAETLDVRYD